MRDLPQAIIALLARNPNHDGHGERDNRNARDPPLPSYNNQNRPLAYDEDDNEDDEYEEHIHGGYRGPVRECARDNQEYHMKMELPSFNGYVTIEEFLDLVTEVERFFAYMETSEDKQVGLVGYKLKGGSIYMVGSFVVDSHSLEESLSTFMKVNEEADGGMVFATKLSPRIVQAILGLLIRF